MDSKELLINGFESFGIQNISDEIYNKFKKYKELLQDWNKRMNLTSVTEDREILIKHFLDSASVLSVLKKPSDQNRLKLIDVGTGAGFPGIPVKILEPGYEVVLLDSLNKRINFLNETIKQLEIENITCYHMRAEEAGRDKDFREQFDICVSRAVARLCLLSEYCLPFVKVGGDFVAMKGPDVKQEIFESEIAVEALGGEIVDVKSVLLPYSEINHTLIVIKKVRQTPAKYPRTSSQMSKSPIK